jgi:hypothetical protein
MSARLDKLIDAKPSAPEYDELDILNTLVEAYEEKHCPIPPPDPVEAIKLRMDQLGLKQSDIASIRRMSACAKQAAILVTEGNQFCANWAFSKQDASGMDFAAALKKLTGIAVFGARYAATAQ